jgi:hypothetical protein
VIGVFVGFCTKVKRKCKKFTIFIFSLFSFGFFTSAVKPKSGMAEIGHQNGLGICDYAAVKRSSEP